MTVAFNNIPSNLRVPLFYAEMDNSQANTATLNQRTLIIAQITSAGTATPNTPIISSGVTDAIAKGGAGSMLHLLTQAYRDGDTFGEVWYLPLADDGSGVAASGGFKFTHVATAAGALNLYIAGQRVTMAVASTQTLAQLATALAAKVNAATSLPVTAAVDGSDNTKVNFTAKNKGLAGNYIDIRVNYMGLPGGEVTPDGLTYTITAMASGATNPTLTTGLANLGDMEFDFIVMPYTDSTSLNAIKSFLDDTTGRWSPLQMLYGGFFAAYSADYAGLVTFGTGRNDQHGTVMGVYDSPTPPWVIAAQVCAAAANSLRIDPARPLQTLQIKGMQAPPVASRFDLTERNTLLYDGVSTFKVGDDGTCYIENLITTYQKNAFDNPDDSYLQVETLYLSSFILRSLRTVVTSKYARMKLADGGTRFRPGSAIVTPNIIKADLIAHYRQLEADGYVQGSDDFAEHLIVERNTSNPSRVDVLYPAEYISGLRILALRNQFRF